jgi:hypothetical protein
MMSADTLTQLDPELVADLDSPKPCESLEHVAPPAAEWLGIPPCLHMLALCANCKALRLHPLIDNLICIICEVEFAPAAVRWEPLP